MKKRFLSLLLIFCLCLTAFAQLIPNYSPDIRMEKLGRGLVAYRDGTSTIRISWRYLKSDDINISFNIYRSIIVGGTEGSRVLVNSSGPVSKSTFFSAYLPNANAIWFFLREVHDGVESENDAAAYLLKSTADGGGNPYIEIPMKQVAGDVNWIYSPNDASFADLDGDGEMELIIHRAGVGKDNAQSGITDAPVIQAYKLDGTFLWEINLGINIREGAHYTQFMVYDLDGDGKAELVCKTAEGGTDGVGNYIGEAYFPTYVKKFNLGLRTYNRNADYRLTNGYIPAGPEFLTVFNGETGAEISTVEYDPPRYSTIYNNGNEVPVLNPTESQIQSRWGSRDSFGNLNRTDRFLACIAYLDGINPSVVMCRGYYTRSVLVAYDFVNGQLTKRWKFDTYAGGSASPWISYEGQGNHNLRVGDVDGDGFDEIVYGSCTIDHDGTGLYNTRRGHGDALHLSDYIPERPGLEVLAVHENKTDGTTLRDAATGQVIHQVLSADDVGRGMGTDVSSAYRGMEWWSARSGGVRSSETGNVISSGGTSMNMACWWDGDLLRELQDGTSVTKYMNGSASTLFSGVGVSSNNSTKSNPCIVGDIIGDWREEVVLRTNDNRFVRIYMTHGLSANTSYRFHSFLQDPVYRLSIAYQNVAYNQPTHTGFYFGSDLEDIFVPKQIVTEAEEYELDPIFDGISYAWSTGETSKTIMLKRSDFTPEVPERIKLTMNYLGYLFSDSIDVIFKNPTSTESIQVSEPVKLLSTVVHDELSLEFSEAGLYTSYFYDMKGALVMKMNLKVSGKSIHTLDAASLPKGAGIVVIQKGKAVYREKFIKL